MNTKIVLFVVTTLLITNIITYKIAYGQGEFKSYLANVAIDIMRLKMYYDTGICADKLTLNIEGLFVAAARSGNMDQFASICKVFKKESFESVEELSAKYPPLILDDFTKTLHKEIEIGKKKIKNLCNIP